MTALAIQRTGQPAHKLREHRRSTWPGGESIRKTGWMTDSPVVFASVGHVRTTPSSIQANQQFSGVLECYATGKDLKNQLIAANDNGLWHIGGNQIIIGYASMLSAI